jgi:hypothetical protein
VIKQFDYYLLFSWFFLIFVAIDCILRKTEIKKLISKYIKALLKYRFRLMYPHPNIPMIQNRLEINQTNHLHKD